MTDAQDDRRRRNRRRIWIAVAVIIILLLLLLCYCRERVSVATLHPLDHGPTLMLGDAVVTGFSGVLPPDKSKTLPQGQTEADATFINGDAPSARIFDPRDPEFVWNGNYWAMPHRRDIAARDVGQVFGIAIDNTAYPNIYFAATSVYGLNLAVFEENGIVRRVKSGEQKASWAPAQFGPNGGPGSIWKVDGRSGAISKFADVMLDGKSSGAASLGTVAYDAAHHQLFVSDLSTGMIHRFSLSGADLGHFDHGVDGRKQAGLSSIAYNASLRADISKPAFDTEKPATWGFTAPARRVWGMAMHEGRLYYAVAHGEAGDDKLHAQETDTGQIWSVGIDKHGKFEDDARIEIILPGESKSAPISDIVFTHEGAMIVAQRAVIGSRYDYHALPPTAVAHVFRFWPETPNDPDTQSGWYQQPEEYGVGFARDNRSTSGGVALGYGYTAKGKIDFKDCEEAIYFGGDLLRDFQEVDQKIVPSGPLKLFGLQISPLRPVRAFNTPPLISYFVNYADKMDSLDHSGTIGDVDTYTLGCKGLSCAAAPGALVSGESGEPGILPPPAGPPPGGPPPGGPPPPCVGIGCVPVPPCVGADCPHVDPECVGPDCPHVDPECVGPDCPTVTPEACMKVEGEAVCDPDAGGWVYKIITQDSAGISLDTLTTTSTTPGVTVSNGPDITVVPAPGVIALSGTTPGQSVTIDVCGFNNMSRASGKPYDCCHSTLTVTVPQEVCLPKNPGATQ